MRAAALALLVALAGCSHPDCRPSAQETANRFLRDLRERPLFRVDPQEQEAQRQREMKRLVQAEVQAELKRRKGEKHD